MRHRLKFGKLNRTSAHRKALLRNMSVALLQHERVRTTLAKAKELRPFVEKLVTKARKGENLCVRRKLISMLQDKSIVDKLIDDLSPRFVDRAGGYLRIMKNGFRYGDCSPMAVIEFVDYKSN